MRLAIRPYLIAGSAIASAAAIIVLLPTAPQLPDVRVPTVQPAGSEHADLDMHDLLGLLANSDGLVPAPDAMPGPGAQGLNPPGELPDLGGLPDPVIAPPDPIFADLPAGQ